MSARPDERAHCLPSRIQARLEILYGLEAPPVAHFVRPDNDGGRERLLIRNEGDELEIALVLPEKALEPARPRSMGLDLLCQVIEGVSHFLYVAERARRSLPTTQLELELQAEVDKYLLLARPHEEPDPVQSAQIRERLFERASFAHLEDSIEGARYRLASRLAAKWTKRLETRFAFGSKRARKEALRAEVRRFHGAGQGEKIALAQAA